MCMCVLQEELRPEYEEALQEKKAKMKSQSKKKVLHLSVCFCVFQIQFHDLQHRLS